MVLKLYWEDNHLDLILHFLSMYASCMLWDSWWENLEDKLILVVLLHGMFPFLIFNGLFDIMGFLKQLSVNKK